jgi:hypothetical protein
MKYFGEQAFGKVVYPSHQFRHKLSLTESDVIRTYNLDSDFFLGAGTFY